MTEIVVATIKIVKHHELDEAHLHKVNELAMLEFGHVPIVKSTEWARPDWTVLYLEDDKLVSFYHIIERDILVDKQVVNAAGINNVITPQPFRGRGFATRMLKRTEDFLFKDLKKEVALLLCSNDLVPFYRQLGWEMIDCPVYFSQREGVRRWEANAMIRGNGRALNPKEVNLNGLPW